MAVIITCAVTGGGDTAKLSPAVPVKPADIARECLAAAAAGAAIVHIHVRDPATTRQSMDVALYREVVARIRDAGTDVLINLTTGPGARFVPAADDPRMPGPGTTMATPQARVAHILELKPDVCSLDVATFNFGAHAFVNIPGHLSAMAKLIKQASVKPELEVFDLGHIRLARHLIETGDISEPPLFQLCLGIPWGATASPRSMMAMRDELPAGAMWAGFGISRQQFPMVAQAVVLGGHVRVGLEDNLYLSRGVLAPGNAPLVERAVKIIELLGSEVATPKQARQLLGLGKAG